MLLDIQEAITGMQLTDVQLMTVDTELDNRVTTINATVTDTVEDVAMLEERLSHGEADGKQTFVHQFVINNY